VGQYEPPITESLTAVTYLLTGGESFAVPRIWSTLFWLAAGAALFFLLTRSLSPWVSLLGLAYYLVLPFSVQASRSFQPDPLMTSAFVIGIYFLYLLKRVGSKVGNGQSSLASSSALQLLSKL
jgi:4-amino-4-deoxy-L-arabinose transferase-like glycosyltransferase